MEVTNARSCHLVSYLQPEWWLMLINLTNGFILLLSKFSQTNLAWLFWGISAWTPRFPDPAPRFDTLPPELIERILAELDCQDILTIRRCSKNILTISKARSVWENAIQQYLTAHPWLPKPEEPLHAYSNSELEQWLVNRTRAQHGWNSASSPRLRPTSQAQATNITLIPGGRWLLTNPVDGFVTVYDLETSEMKSKILISPLDNLDAYYSSLMAISMDNDSSVLEFDLALTSRTPIEFSGLGSRSRLHIWRVTLSGHGQDAELTALHITSFAVTTPDIPHFLALDGEYIAQVKSNRIEIYRWPESTSTTHTVAVILSKEQPNWISFLPGARLLSFSSTNMDVYDIPPFKLIPASSNPPIHAWTPLVWQIPCCGYHLSWGGVSTVWTDDDATRFTVTTEDDVQAVTIPTSPDQPPQLTNLNLQQYSDGRFLVGLHHSISHDYRSIAVLTHRRFGAWKIEPNHGITNTTVRLCPTPEHHRSSEMRPWLDEASARLVLVTRLDHSNAGMFLVVDFSDMV